jgi:hypothetical protein
MRDESFCETDTEWTGRVKERYEQCTMTASFPENGQKQSPSISGATSRKPATRRPMAYMNPRSWRGPQ